MRGSIEDAKGDAHLYEYRGKGAGSDIVSKVKKHHADENEIDFGNLVGRKVASGGKTVKTTLVVVAEVGV